MSATNPDVKKKDGRAKSYIRNCTKCGKKIYVAKLGIRICGACRHLSNSKRKTKYPRLFFYNKLSAYARDKFQCQVCHCDLKNEPKKNPPVHHIDGNIKNNVLANLVTLCNKCHVHLHNTFTNEELATYNFHQLFKLGVFTPVKERIFVKKDKVLRFKNI